MGIFFILFFTIFVIMRLYYTGSSKPAIPQTNPDKSLGGFMSSSLLPNDFFNNIFSDVSKLSIQNKLVETRAVALLNEEIDGDVESIRLYYIYPENTQIKLQVAAVRTTLDNCGDPVMEKIPSLRGKPLYATFYEASADYARGTMTITVAPSNGDIISINQDNVAIATTSTFSQTTPTIEDAIDAIVDAFEDNTYYEVTKVVNSVTLVPELKFRKLVIGDYTNELELDTAGTAYADSVVLSGGFDNSVNIGDLEYGKYIGLWFRKTILPSVLSSQSGEAYCEQLFEDFEDGVTPETEEKIELFLSWNDDNSLSDSI